VVRNHFCELVNIDVPIVQGAMGGASCPALAAAVAEAGGVGFLAPWTLPPDALRQQIRATRALTQKPFGVNLVLTQPQEERLAICLEEGVPLISFFWAQPGKLIDIAHRGGAKVFHTVPSADEAARAVDAGADVIVAQGWEAGGHVNGTVSTMALVPMVVDRVGSVPVLAAGGIADGRALAAAMALGASGAWIGTRFLGSTEAAIHPRYRDLLIAANETDTVYGTLFDVGWPDAPHRSLRNKTIDDWEASGRQATGQRTGEGDVVARISGKDVVRYQSFTPRAGTEGDIDAMSLWAGQGVGLLRSVQPAGDIVREIVADARATIAKISARFAT